jgi:hypothetical protein
VKPEDADKVDVLLRGEGFAPLEEEGLDDYRSQTLYSRDDGICLDMHRGLIGRMLHNRVLGIDMNDVWSKRRRISRDNVSVDTLDFEYTIIYQCLHLSMQHSFSGIRWYVDINEFIKRHGEKIDWDKLLALALRYRIRKPVYYSLLFAKDLFSAPVPGRILDELRKSTGGWDRWFFRKIRKSSSSVEYFAELSMFDSARDAAKFIALSLVVYPRRLLHFSRISGSILKTMLWKNET